MISTSSHDHDSETPFVEFLKSLEAADDPSTVIDDFARRFPQHEVELRELARLNGALNGGEKREFPPPPERLGEFILIRRVDGGGMGEIYEAYHERLDRRVALKIIRRGWSSLEARERFLREQLVLANLHHSHIVPIHTGGEDGEIQYFTMPYINGASLNYVVSAVASFDEQSKSSKTPRVSEIVERVVHQSDTRGSQSTLTHQAISTKLSEEERPNLPPGLRLSCEYIESVVKTMAEVADAVEYAHNAGVLHRDLKPSNVMVEPNGHCWVIDFGLAAARTHRNDERPQASQKDRFALNKKLTQLGRGGGTVNYMSPERWQGLPADKLSDVFSLGAMLYELLTLRRAFDGRTSSEIAANIIAGKHPAAHELVRPLTIDLEAIAEKAMHREPARRYQSAGDFGEDLRRWLKNEPTVARPPWIPRRLLMWAQRKPAFALAVFVAILAIIATFTTVVDSYKNRAKAAEHKSAVHLVQTRAARRESALQQLQNQIQQLQYQILSEHTAGWSEKCWDNVRKIVEYGPNDELKELAAATLLGVDAQIIKEIEFGPTQMAYDPTGQHLAMVGTSGKFNNSSLSPLQTQIWSPATNEVKEYPQVKHDATGPIAYLPDGVPVQLAWQSTDPKSILLWNIQNQVVARRLECPFPLSEPPLSWSLVPGGSHVAALVSNQGVKHVLVWETNEPTDLGQRESNAIAIELSPDGSLLAAACAKGAIEIWSTQTLERIATLSDSHTDVLCFAWTKDRVRSVDGSESGWILAAGRTGGDVMIWDLDRKTVRSRCIGSAYEILRLTFSPDGMTLASAGRDAPILWDVGTGNMLLKLLPANTMTSIAFSPDGESLAIGSRAVHGAPNAVQVYHIQENRGQQTLRGLRARVTQVHISADNRIVAAMADNWQLAVWDLQLHRLLHIFQCPVGVYAQSAGVAIDADNRRIAVAAGNEVNIWDIDSGALQKNVHLDRGFLDSLVFKDRDSVILARQESINPALPASGPNEDPDKNPRVCRVRNILGGDPKKTLLEIADFKRSAVSITVTPDGNRLLIQGFDEPGKLVKHRMTKLFDLPSGVEVWPERLRANSSTNGIGALDPRGKFVAMMEENSRIGGWNAIVDLESGRRVRTSEYSYIGIGPNASINVVVGGDGGPGDKPVRTVVDEFDQELVRIGQIKHSSERVEISNDSHYVLFGCSDGSVTVTDLHFVQRKLAAVGLGW